MTNLESLVFPADISSIEGNYNPGRGLTADISSIEGNYNPGRGLPADISSIEGNYNPGRGLAAEIPTPAFQLKRSMTRAICIYILQYTVITIVRI